jgi:chromosome segregation ATPase
MSGAASDDPGPYPLAEVVRAAVAAQERSLDLAQAWSPSLEELLRDQAEGGLAALEALRSTLAAMERALESQEEANRAMRQSLDAYRAVIERATATQQRTAQLVQASLDAFTSATQAQLETVKAFLVPLGAQPETIAGLVQEWNAAMRRLFQPPRGGDRGS